MAKVYPIPYRVIKWILGTVMFWSTLSADVAATSWDELTPPQRIIAVNVGAAGSIMVWGFNHWDYGNQRAHVKREYWFSQSTKHGGADKLGHSYTSYVLTSGFRQLYIGWGYDRDGANRRAAFSSFLLTGLMEVGDAFSNYGFSYEDMVMNAAGSAASYWLGKHETVSSKISFRVEYGALARPDIFTDYENMKFLIAIKPAGFGRGGIWQYMEVNAGYYTRGYDDDLDTMKKRKLFFGFGLNLSHILNKLGRSNAATILDFVQLPGAYAAFEDDIND